MNEHDVSIKIQAEWLVKNMPAAERQHLRCDHVPEPVREIFLLIQLGAIIERMSSAASARGPAKT